MRKGEWAEAAKVSGIECAGQKVAALMGGMGRTIGVESSGASLAVSCSGRRSFHSRTVPLHAIVDRAAAGSYQAKPVRVFRFEEIREAHQMMESNQANGKLVVRL